MNGKHYMKHISRKYLLILALVMAISLFTKSDFAWAENDANKIKQLQELYNTNKGWVIRSFVVLGLGETKHPKAVKTISRALEEKNKYLSAFALITLSKMPTKSLQSGLTKESITYLIKKYLSRRNEFYRTKALDILKRVTGQELEIYRDWSRWWKKNKDDYRPKPMTTGKRVISKGGYARTSSDTIALTFYKRLVYLKTNGLDLVLAIDVTGSMQPCIDETKKELGNMLEIVKAVAPRFKIGLITYWDHAVVRKHLSEDIPGVLRALNSITANGGDDIPEGVDKALEKALLKMVWRKKATKIIIIIGDAPPHKQDEAKAYKLAEDAHNLRLGLFKKSKRVLTGSGKTDNKNLIPKFIINTIVTSGGGGDVGRTFSEIANRGGGTMVCLGDKSEIVDQILILTFGTQWETEIRKFTKIFARILQVEKGK